MTYKHVTYETAACRAARQDCIDRQGECGGCPHAVPSLGGTCMIRQAAQVIEALGPATKPALAKVGADQYRSMARLGKREVWMILDAIEQGEILKSIAARFGVSTSAVGKIATGRTWSDVRVEWEAAKARQAG